MEYIKIKASIISNQILYPILTMIIMMIKSIKESRLMTCNFWKILWPKIWRDFVIQILVKKLMINTMMKKLDKLAAFKLLTRTVLQKMKSKT